MSISVEGHSGKHVARLANLVAQTYIKRQETKRHRAIQKAIAISRTQLGRIEAASAARETAASAKSPKAKKGEAPKSSSSAANVIQATNLQTKINELESTLGSPTAVQLKAAKPSAAKLQSPKPRKDAEFGFVIGLVLAALAAVAASRLDRRLRTLGSLESALGMPMLTVLPKVNRPVVREGAAVRPSKLLLEPLRRFDTELMILSSSNGVAPAPVPRVILLVSPDPGDGKSTLAADFALVQRDAGKHVLVIEANFRRPVLARMLGIEANSLLPEVLSGRIEPDDAMQRVLPVHTPEVVAQEGAGAVATATQTGTGSLWALTAERTVANPPALLAQPAVGELLRGLAERFDSILIDAPSPLEFSDAVPLFGMVDAIVAIARAGHSREASAMRLRQMLATPGYAPTIGMVGNFVGSRDLQRYGFASGGGAGWLGRRGR
jgi:succinoglycan biosynthesis transport protein ExoP